MEKISDSLLIGELKRRLDENKRSLDDLRTLTKKLEAVNYKLKESESLKSNFLSNIRNEINNPLSAIIALSQQMANGDVPSDKIPDISRMIFAESFELDFQLRNIFMAAELEAGEASLHVARINIPTFISRSLEYFTHKIEERKLAVKVDCVIEGCDDGEAPFTTDPEKLHIIMVNILANAIEFSPAGKSIFVKAWKEGNNLKVSIEDKGIGIENDMQQEIFDRFKQLSSGVRKMYKGHGLGLSIVKSLLDLMEGTVELSSVVGEGTTFTVTLPECPYIEGADIFSEDGNEFIFDDDEDVSEGEVQEF